MGQFDIDPYETQKALSFAENLATELDLHNDRISAMRDNLIDNGMRDEWLMERASGIEEFHIWAEGTFEDFKMI